MGLLDIAPAAATQTVATAEGPLDVRGIGASQLAKLMRRFPDFGKFFAGVSGINPESLSEEAAAKAGIPFDKETAFEVSLMMQEAMPAIIAAGVGHPGEPAYEAAAECFATDDQLALFSAIMALTRPKAPRPLAEAPAGQSQPEAGASTLA